MKKLLLLLIIPLLFLNGCDKDDNKKPNQNYLVFGHYYGMCGGESCVEIFKINNKNLWEDLNDAYPSPTNYYVGDFYTLDNNLFNQVSDLITFFPSDLLNEKAIVIGMPDYADGGGLYIEYNYFGEHKFWLIDQIKTNVPDYLHNFIDIVNDKISIINS
jgi:hypothetical protein